MSMTPAELRELAGEAEELALKTATACIAAGWADKRSEAAERANRLFLMARNLRERADELRAEEFREAFRRSQPKPGEFVTL